MINTSAFAAFAAEIAKLPEPPKTATFFIGFFSSCECLIAEVFIFIFKSFKNVISSMASGSSPIIPIPIC
mgnify:CR=1 FL=1